MHLDKPSLAKYLGDPNLQGYAVLQKIFFAPTSRSSGWRGFYRKADPTQRRSRAHLRTGSRPSPTGGISRLGEIHRSALRDLKSIQHPTPVVNGIHDKMIPVQNSYWLSANLPNAVLLTYPDSGHGSLFQFHDSFTRQAAAFLAFNSEFAPY